MTKRNLLLASLLLVLGLGLVVPFAAAQGTEQGNGSTFNVTSSLYTLRPNSIGDAAGPVYISYASGLGTLAGGEVITVTFSKPIVGGSGISSAPLADFCANGDIANGLNLPVPNVCGSLSASVPKGQPNVLQLTVSNTPITGFSSGTISIWGLRFDTVGLSPLSFITATVGAVLNQSYPMSFGTPGSTSAAPVNVGQVGYNPTYGWGSVAATTANVAPVSPALSGFTPASFLTCYMGKTNDFAINVTEQWAGSWTSLSDEQHLAPYLATNGSNISITLSGIPSAVTVASVEAPVTTTGTAFTWGPVTTTTTSSGAVTFDFPLLTTTRDEIEGADFIFSVTTTGPIAGQLGPITASVTLEPLTPTYASLYPAFTYPTSGPNMEEPYFPLPVVNFLGCQSNLLFPYVTNYTSGSSALGNWDTGIVVANTSSDPYGLEGEVTIYGDPAGATPTAGSCTFYVYASTSGSLTPSSDASPVYTFTRPPVYTGGVDSFLLSSTKAKGLPAGYAIAVCNFLNGTGYALIADNANGLGNWGVMGNYLAYVIPNPFEDPRWYNAQWGEFAITPFPWYNYYGNYPLPNVRKGNAGGATLRAPRVK